ncbi:hypothetical protein C8F01DRAFT_1160053 [Mycena amicta]|nr:hypothetical protein C8F01DRAFT_1160053 [Mycena amicta]
MAGRFPFPSRARLKPSGALPDILWTSLTALRESSDAFPPLKSAVGGVVVLCNIAERAKHSKSDARDIALRTKKILDVVAEAVPDPTAISPAMLKSIERFTLLLAEIHHRLEPIVRASSVSRIVSLNRNERTLAGIKAQLDDAYRDLVAASALRVEVQQTKIALQQKTHIAIQQTQLSAQQTQTQLDLGKIATTTTHVLLYSKVSVFFLASP